MSSPEGEALFKKMLERYLSGELELTGVLVVVNEETHRVDMLTLNTSNMEAFMLMLHGLNTLHDKAISTTVFNKTVH